MPILQHTNNNFICIYLFSYLYFLIIFYRKKNLTLYLIYIFITISYNDPHNHQLSILLLTQLNAMLSHTHNPLYHLYALYTRSHTHTPTFVYKYIQRKTLASVARISSDLLVGNHNYLNLTIRHFFDPFGKCSEPFFALRCVCYPII